MLFLPDFLSFLILFVLGRTVTLQTAFFPLDVFAVIVAFPTPFAVIFPPEETAATFLFGTGPCHRFVGSIGWRD